MDNVMGALKLRSINTFFVFLFCTSLPFHVVSAAEFYYQMHKDPFIPRLGDDYFLKLPQYPVESKQSGKTSQAIWDTSKGPIGPNAFLRINSGHHVLIDGDLDVYGIVIRPGGTLEVLDNNVTIRVVHFIVERENDVPGKLIMGTPGDPLQSNIQVIFRNVPINTSNPNISGYDPAQYGNGLLGFGDITICGVEKTPFVRLSAEPKAGQSSLSFVSAVNGWKTGDKLVIPNTEYPTNLIMKGSVPHRPLNKTEERIISSAGGTSVSLASALTYDHLGARDGDGITIARHFNGEQLHAHVGNLTRNIVFRSEDPKGTRGHTMFHFRADVDIRYVAFIGMGRTTTLDLDSTTFDDQGNATKIGTNNIGRYSVHFHHLYGAFPAKHEYQFTMIGCVIDENPKWGLAIHGSHYGLIKGNVIYNAEGSGIVTEDGSESFNVFDGNFVVHNIGEKTGIDRSGRTDFLLRHGDAYGFVGCNNTVINNVAADNVEGFTYYVNITIVFETGKRLPIRVPLFPGADTHVLGQYKEISGVTMGVGPNINNEAYCSAKFAHASWSTNENRDQPTAYFEKTVLWNNVENIFMDYAGSRFKGLIVRGPGKGIFGHNANGNQMSPLEFEDASFQGQDVVFSWDNRPTFNSIFTNCEFQSKVGVYISNYAQGARPQHTIHNIFRNCSFKAMPGQPFVAIQHDLRVDPAKANDPDATLAVSFKVITELYDHQKIPGNNKRVYFNSQDKNYLIPKRCSSYNSFGEMHEVCICPEDKADGSPHSTLECTTNFGPTAAYFQEMAPCSDTTSHPEIKGIACPMASAGNLPPTVNAGVDQTVIFPAGVTVEAKVTDDGLPNPPEAVTTKWIKVGGPGTVTFEKDTLLKTNVTFSAPGTYILRLVANDGELAGSDELTVRVKSVEEPNEKPNVSAGPDLKTSNGTVELKGQVNDDGLPNPPGRLSLLWYKESGPGNVSFADEAALQTTAAFDQAGLYTLILRASDGELIASDSVAVDVEGPSGRAPNGGGSGSGGSSGRGRIGAFDPRAGELLTLPCPARITDIHGRFIAPVSNPFEWDGRNESNNFVPYGVYHFFCEDSSRKGSFSVSPTKRR